MDAFFATKSVSFFPRLQLISNVGCVVFVLTTEML